MDACAMSKNRHKRLFPKKYSASYVKTSRIDGIKAAAYNAQRSKATVGLRADAEHKLDSNFMESVPMTGPLTRFERKFVNGTTGEDLSLHEQKQWQRSQKGRTVDKKHELLIVEQMRKEGRYLTFCKVWQSKYKQGVDEYICQTLIKNKKFSIKLYFCGLEALFVQEDEEIRFISKTYKGLSVAMQHYKNNNISWDRKESV